MKKTQQYVGRLLRARLGINETKHIQKHILFLTKFVCEDFKENGVNLTEFIIHITSKVIMHLQYSIKDVVNLWSGLFGVGD